MKIHKKYSLKAYNIKKRGKNEKRNQIPQFTKQLTF